MESEFPGFTALAQLLALLTAIVSIYGFYLRRKVELSRRDERDDLIRQKTLLEEKLKAAKTGPFSLFRRSPPTQSSAPGAGGAKKKKSRGVLALALISLITGYVVLENTNFTVFDMLEKINFSVFDKIDIAELDELEGFEAPGIRPIQTTAVPEELMDAVVFIPESGVGYGPDDVLVFHNDNRVTEFIGNTKNEYFWTKDAERLCFYQFKGSVNKDDCATILSVASYYEIVYHQRGYSVPLEVRSFN